MRKRSLFLVVSLIVVLILSITLITYLVKTDGVEGSLSPSQEEANIMLVDSSDSEDYPSSSGGGTSGFGPSAGTCDDNDGDGYGVCPNCGTANGCLYEGNDCSDDPARKGVNIFPGNDNNYCDCDASTGLGAAMGWPSEGGICDDGIDNDCNLQIDCGDNSCVNNPVCTGTICGNAKIEIDEECDDGNIINSDGCSSSCKLEPGRTCLGSPSVCYWLGQEEIDVVYDNRRPLVITGDEEIVYDWSSDRCEYESVADLAMYPWKDNEGRIHFILPNSAGSYQMVGTDFSNLELQCQSPVSVSHGNPDPAMYDSHEWMGGKWFDSETGIIHALVHNEYHAREYPTSGCVSISGLDCNWWTVNYAYSNDGGLTFEHDPAPNQFVYAPPYQFDPNAGRDVVGIDSQTNIIFLDGWYYTLLSLIGPYRDIPSGSKVSIMRTNDLSDPSSWRAWDGEYFSIEPNNPYTNPIANPIIPKAFNKVEALPTSISDNRYLEKYLLSMLKYNLQLYNPFIGRFEENNVAALSLSDDLINWDYNIPYRFSSKLYTQDLLYPSIIDHGSSSQNFETSTQTPYLYFVRWYNFWLLNRDVMRIPMKILKTEDYSLTLSNAGFDYFGITRYNHPVVGNDYLELIGVNTNGINYFDKISNGGLVFEINSERVGIIGDDTEIILNEKREINEYYTFSNSEDYNEFILTGGVNGGINRQSDFFDKPFIISGGIGLVPDNIEPSIEGTSISSTSSSVNDNLICTAQGSNDPNSDLITNSYSFKVKNNGEQKFYPFETMIHSFDVLENIPPIIGLPSDKIIDISGTGNDITYNLGVSTVPVQGIYGNAALFNGNNFLFIKDPKDLELGGSKTIEFWIKTTQETPGIVISYDDPSDESSFFYYVYYSVNGNIFLYFSYDDVTEYIVNAGLVNDDNWHHVAFVLDKNNNKIKSYLDGSLVQDKSWPTSADDVIPFTSLSYFTIGGSLKHPSSTLNGALDELRIYSYALPDNMILAHYNLEYNNVTSDMTLENQEWKCSATPDDGKIYGKEKESNSLVITCSTCSGSNSSSSSSGSSSSGGGSSSGGTVTYQCSDGVDNDGDLLIDYPNDSGCSSATDNTELSGGGLGSNLTNGTDGDGNVSGDETPIINKPNSVMKTIIFWTVVVALGVGAIVWVIKILKYLGIHKKLVSLSKINP